MSGYWQMRSALLKQTDVLYGIMHGEEFIPLEKRRLGKNEIATAITEMRLDASLMATSKAWFFDRIYSKQEILAWVDQLVKREQGFFFEIPLDTECFSIGDFLVAVKRYIQMETHTRRMSFRLCKIIADALLVCEEVRDVPVNY